MVYDVGPGYVDLFANSNGSLQMGDTSTSVQHNQKSSRARHGDTDILERSFPETLSEKYARWSPSQPDAEAPAEQMGGWVMSSQQMG